MEEALRSAAGEIAGWLVTESVPLAPPAVPPGDRTPGLSNIAFIRRPETMTSAQWLDRWHNHHTTLAIETQATFGYVQNTVIRSLTPGAFPVDGIVEELFPIEACTDQHAFYGSGGDPDELARRMRSMFGSVSTFLEGEATGVMPTSRFVLTSPFA
ncbi:EthD domain-containing protein [Nocardioides sp. JQ2195]|nr:EthD domain-containing protein [Nocardioides sp. JQ2195]